MDFIHPILPTGPVRPVRRTVSSECISQSRQTAAKVSRIRVPVVSQTSFIGRQIALLKDVQMLSKKIKGDWNFFPPEKLAEKIVELEDKISLLEGTSAEVEKVKKQAEHFHFQFVFPIGLEVQLSKTVPSFAQNTYRAAKQIFKTHSLQPFHGLNPMQQREILRYAGQGNTSPEGLAHAMREYIGALQRQVAVAEDFFFGRLDVGMEGLLQLPEDVRLKIDQLIWDAAGGNAIDPTETSSQSLIAGAIMHSVEERMGMLEE